MINGTVDSLANIPAKKSTRSNTRKRILFIGEAISLAHVARPAVLARWARDAGYDVTFACGDAYHWVARAEGLNPLPLPTLNAREFIGRVQAGRFFHTGKELDSYIKAERNLLASVQPDLVVGDFRLSLGISAQLEKVPLLNLLNAHWSPAAESRFPAPSSGPLGFLPHGLQNRIFEHIRPLAFRLFARTLQQAYRRNGLAVASDFRACYAAGEACAYTDIPAFQPLPKLLNGHFFLGPILWWPNKQAAPAPTQLDTLQNPLAYVSVGSSGTTESLPAILNAMLGLGLDIALAGVDDRHYRQLTHSIPDLRNHCAAGKFWDPRPALKRACLTVCHGGSGTVYQSLAYGVPLLCLPSNPDQGLVSASVERLNVGLSLPDTRHINESVLAALERLMVNENFSIQAKKLSASIDSEATRQRWLRFLADQQQTHATSQHAYRKSFSNLNGLLRA